MIDYIKWFDIERTSGYIWWFTPKVDVEIQFDVLKASNEKEE